MNEIIQNIDTKEPLKAELIYLKGHMDPLRNRKILITDSFLIVSGRTAADAPIWFNLDTISRLEGVKPIEKNPVSYWQ